MAGGSTVTFIGIGFGASPTVQFGSGNTVPVVNATATMITVTTPAHAVGAVDVTVTINGQQNTLAGAYMYGTLTVLPPSQPGPAPSGGPPNPIPLPPRTQPGNGGGIPNLASVPRR